MEKIKKTNAARILDQRLIAYELIPYPVTETELGAEHVAETLHEPIERVFKTILVRGDKTGPLVGVVPGNFEVALKEFARVSGNKRIDTVPLQGTHAAHRLYPRWMLPDRPQEAFPDFHPRNGDRIRHHLYQRRTTRSPAENRAKGSDRSRPRQGRKNCRTEIRD